MAKSRNKSKKSNKKTKKASAASSKTKQTQNKKASARSEKTTKVQNSSTVVRAQSKNSKAIYIVAAVVVFMVSVFAVSELSSDDKTIRSSAKPTPNPSSQQTIKVVEPNASGTPEATGYPIQGSSPTEQEAKGGLQQPQTADQLQPNAKIEDYENAELN